MTNPPEYFQPIDFTSQQHNIDYLKDIGKCIMTKEGKLRLLVRVRNIIRVKHYSIRTEQAYAE